MAGREPGCGRKGWEQQGADHLQLPWPLCVPLLLSREGRPDPEFWSVRPGGEGLRGRATVVWRMEPVQAGQSRESREEPRKALKWQVLGDRMSTLSWECEGTQP